MHLNKYIDHTLLKPTALVEDIKRLCSEALQYNFAAVCMPPPMLKTAKARLENSTVKLATVIGFPFGYSAVEAKIAEIILAIVDGADELDIVINLIALKNNDWQYLANEINHILSVAKQKNKIVKVIIESGVLTDEEIIRCCELYGAAGVDFLKTSTGYAEKGATIHAVELIRKHLPKQVQIKASGGIKTYQFAKELIDAGATRLGCSSSVQIVSNNL
ncbi:MAG TPA: deoxyribose-phosphate aldolase [Parafilimonas sp.]|jgi:deoxyribose-phosphate aldolase